MRPRLCGWCLSGRSDLALSHLLAACSTVLPASSRIESYSCKMAGDDKHMFKQFCQEGQPHVLEALSPPQTSGLSPSR